MILPLCYYGNPVLRETAEPVTEFGPELKQLASDMVETMRDEAGIGLAGPQVGVRKRIFVMEIPADMDDEANPNPQVDYPLTVVNPGILDPSDLEEEMEEGCLSIPDVRGKVVRPESIRMGFQTLEGEHKELYLSGLAARCAQHETDHLNGVLFVDYLGSVKKMAIKGKLRKIKEQYGVAG